MQTDGLRFFHIMCSQFLLQCKLSTLALLGKIGIRNALLLYNWYITLIMRIYKIYTKQRGQNVSVYFRTGHLCHDGLLYCTVLAVTAVAIGILNTIPLL